MSRIKNRREYRHFQRIRRFADQSETREALLSISFERAHTPEGKKEFNPQGLNVVKQEGEKR
jgi:hypothetical protein